MSLEARVYKRLKPLKNSSILIAVSGGRDSMVLFDLLLRIQKGLGLKISVVHCHHGLCSDKKIVNYRDQTRFFVEEKCLSLKIPFFLVMNKEKELKSEAEMRAFRIKSYKNVLEEQNRDYIFLGHHWEDQLETRLIQLIRGTGNLKAMKFSSPPYIRPFLTERIMALKIYAKHHRVQWVEDPSNQNMQFLRNWIRYKWLKDLEGERTGGIESLGRSLELIANISYKHEQKDRTQLDHNLDRKKFMSLESDMRRNVLHKWLRGQGFSSFTFSQIEEALKRLNHSAKESTFYIGGCRWTIDVQHIRVDRNESSKSMTFF